MKRVRVGHIINGTDQYYQREAEVREGNNFVVKPFFVADKRQAITMSEDLGIALVKKLRVLKANPWLEDVSNERRIEVTSESTQSGKDTRLEVAATLDDENSPEARWYKVKPANTPNGPKWFLRIDLPGVADPQIIYADDALGVLQRAEDMGFLQHAVKYERPLPQTPAPQNSRVGFRRRPGSII
jgi:hypothetical protein